MQLHKNFSKITKNPFFRISSYYLILSLPIATFTAVVSRALFDVYPAEFYWGEFVRFWQDDAGAFVALILSFLAALAALAFKKKRAQKKQKPGFDFGLHSVVKRSLAALGLGLVWLSLLPLPFLSHCIDLFTRKSFIHYAYWKPFGLYHILVDAPQHTSKYDINGFTCRDHLMASGWPIFWAFNISLALGALTVWLILKIRANQKAI